MNDGGDVSVGADSLSEIEMRKVVGIKERHVTTIPHRVEGEELPNFLEATTSPTTTTTTAMTRRAGKYGETESDIQQHVESGSLITKRHVHAKFRLTMQQRPTAVHQLPEEIGGLRRRRKQRVETADAAGRRKR